MAAIITPWTKRRLGFLGESTLHPMASRAFTSTKTLPCRTLVCSEATQKLPELGLRLVLLSENFTLDINISYLSCKFLKEVH